MSAAAAVEVVITPDHIRELLGVQAPLEAVPYMNNLYYGDPGAGKTHLLGTAVDHPDLHPMLLIDLDGGSMTLRKITSGIDVIQVRNMKQVEQAGTSLANENDGYYKSVSLDNITEFQKLDMKEVMQKEYDKKPDVVEKLVPTQRAWGISAERMRMTIRFFRDLPIHFFATAYVGERVDEKTNLTYFAPSLPGKLRAELAGFFDIVGYLRAVEEGSGENRKIVRSLQLAKSERVIAKDRTSALGDVMVNPTIPEMWEKIQATNPKTNGKV